MFNAKVLLDSVAEGRSGKPARLTTIQVTFPRIVLSEFNTHRTMSRNSASSRAIPVKKRISMIESDPFIPEVFGKNQKGMQPDGELSPCDDRDARYIWRSAMEAAVKHAALLEKIEVHKELANRLLEPFAWQTVICSATEWDNFFALRCNPNAQGEIRKAAELMRDALTVSVPQELGEGQWHLPLIFEEDRSLSIDDQVKVSVARCARVSYLTHDGRRDVTADLDLYARLLEGGHNSPMEHAAQVRYDEQFSQGNFRFPFVQHRKMIPGEDVFQWHM